MISTTMQKSPTFQQHQLQQQQSNQSATSISDNQFNNQPSTQNSTAQFLPLELALKYYSKWDCDIKTKSLPGSNYFKCMEGYGQVTFATNNNTYKGNFFNGLMHDPEGTSQFTWAATGQTYNGPFVWNSITGQKGRYDWPDGSYYKGAMLNGKRHGQGEYYNAKDGSKYFGAWDHGIKHGNGRFQFGTIAIEKESGNRNMNDNFGSNEQSKNRQNQNSKNNEKLKPPLPSCCPSYYQGQFRGGVRHGTGKMRYPSGNTYQGQWAHDKKHGYGVMNWYTQNERYQGEWKYGIQQGLGTYIWFDGKIQYKTVKNIYKGSWRQGHREGFGAFFHSNGCRTEGQFMNNKKEGTVLAMDECGNVKMQQFKEDRLIGTSCNGSITNEVDVEIEREYSDIDANKEATKIATKANDNFTEKMVICNGGKGGERSMKSMKKVPQLSSSKALLSASDSRQNQGQGHGQGVSKSPDNQQLQSQLQQSQKQNDLRSVTTNANNSNTKALKKSAPKKQLPAVTATITATAVKLPALVHAQQSFQEQKQTASLHSNYYKTNNSNLLRSSTSSSKLNNPKYAIQQNIYSKCLDIPIYPLPQRSTAHSIDVPKISPFKLVLDYNILNFLLRENSKLRSWYKHCTAWTITGAANNPFNSPFTPSGSATFNLNLISSPPFYTGMTMQSMWRLIKDLKIMDEYVNLPRINRQFAKGWKSNFDIVLPDSGKLRTVRKYYDIIKGKENQNHSNTGWNWNEMFNNDKVNYSNVEWAVFCEELSSEQQSKEKKEKNNSTKDKQNNQTAQCKNQKQQLSPLVDPHSQDIIDVHNPKKIILFRHFVCYLLRLTFIISQKAYTELCASEQESSQKEGTGSSSKQQNCRMSSSFPSPPLPSFEIIFRNKLQHLFKSIHSLFQSAMKDSKSVNASSADNITLLSNQQKLGAVSPSQDFLNPNRKLFLQITSSSANWARLAGRTVHVKCLYQLLEKFKVLKQPVQKVMFLEKIERWLQLPYPSLLRKQMKSQFPALEKAVYTSPYFQKILSYSLTQKQFEELVYLAVNRKIQCKNKEEAVKKYQQNIQSMITYVKSCREVKKTERPVGLTPKKIVTGKDQIKVELLKRIKQEKIAYEVTQSKIKQKQRQAIQNILMGKQDVRWDQDQLHSSDEQNDLLFD